MQTLACAAEGAVLRRAYALHEVSAFVRAGAILPMAPEPQAVKAAVDATFGEPIAPSTGRATMGPTWDARQPLLGGAALPPKTLVWSTWPGSATAGVGEVLEDCPTNNAYKSGAIASTNASFSVQQQGAHTSMDFQIGPVQGSYEQSPTRRNYELQVHGLLAPLSVELSQLADGGWSSLPKARGAQHASLQSCGRLDCAALGGTAAAWWWEAKSLTATFRVDDVDVHTGVRLRIHLPTPARVHEVLPGGFVAAFDRASRVKTMLDWQKYNGAIQSRALNRLAETADRMQADPASAAAELAAFPSRVAAVLELHAGANCSSRTPAPRHSAAGVRTNSSSTPTGCPLREFQEMMRAWLGPSSLSDDDAGP